MIAAVAGDPVACDHTYGLGYGIHTPNASAIGEIQIPCLVERHGSRTAQSHLQCRAAVTQAIGLRSASVAAIVDTLVQPDHRAI